jgi:hypothetical protein
MKEAFLKFSMEQMEPNMTACDWKHQLELAVVLLKQLIERGTDFEGTTFNERQEKDLHGLLDRCSVHLDIVKRELEEEQS